LTTTEKANYRQPLKRRLGRPKRRWTEEVDRELKGMGVKDWKRLALERDKWKKIVEETKA
jgi:hypothetical protein